MIPNIYVACRPAEAERVRCLVKPLLDLGYQFTSTWIWSDEKDMKKSGVYSDDARALMIELADILIYFPSWIPNLDRAIDLGIAIGMNKKIIIVGEIDEKVYAQHHALTYCEENELTDKVIYLSSAAGMA